uniref:helix-turn-helix domain-containing protein n=1 Tax=Paractinoplanes polyasparticus TaxID=2856853 RepID=UPI001C85F06E|nr:helix-turn-helix transcriptional regulator [Actinoplanes polyasparticus]
MARLRALSAPPPPQPTAVEVCADFEPYRLIQARQMNGWTRRDLSEATGLTPQQIAWFEGGVLTPKAYELERIADATGTLVAFFKRGRPMAILDSSALFMCTTDR